MPEVLTNGRFEPNAYKLMKKPGYDFKNLACFGHFVKANPYGINETQKKIQEQRGLVALPRVGLSYVPSQPVRILGRHKDKQSLVQYIMAKETTKSDEQNVKNKQTSSMFDKLQSSTSQHHPSVFTRIGTTKTPKPSVFQKLEVGTQLKPSVFPRIKSNIRSLSYPGHRRGA